MVINPSLLPPPPHDPWAPNYLATSKAEAQAGEDSGTQAALADPLPLPSGPHLETCPRKGPSKGHVNHCENWYLDS